MPEWMTEASGGLDPSIPTLAIRLAVSWACGFGVALIARLNRPAGTIDKLSVTLVLMSILIAMVTQIIGDNVARAFSLVGALSIVRFRTAVAETRDVAFVLAAVVVGMAIGAGQYWVAGIGMLAVALATQFMPPPKEEEVTATPSLAAWRLTMTVGLHLADGWESELERTVESFELKSAETTRRGSALELVYSLRTKEGFDANKLIASLNTLPNIESVAVKSLG